MKRLILLIFGVVLLINCSPKRKGMKEEKSFDLVSNKENDRKAATIDSLKTLIRFFDHRGKEIPVPYLKKFLEIPFFERAYSGGTTEQIRKLDSLTILVINLQCNAGGICQVQMLFTIRKGHLVTNQIIGEHKEGEAFKKVVGYKFILDSLVESHSRNVEYNLISDQSGVRVGDSTYNESYNYFLIHRNGDILKINNFVDESREFPDSPYKIYSLKDLRNMSQSNRDIMRNEVFASYGYKFKTSKWRTYFEGKEWYNGRFQNVVDSLNLIEKINIERISKIKR